MARIPAKIVAQKQEMGGLQITTEPPITPKPAPVPEHSSLPSGKQLRAPLTKAPLLQHQDSSTKQVMRSSIRTECSLEDLCKMLDGLHLSEKPKPLKCPATFIFIRPGKRDLENQLMHLLNKVKQILSVLA